MSQSQNWLKFTAEELSMYGASLKKQYNGYTTDPKQLNRELNLICRCRLARDYMRHKKDRKKLDWTLKGIFTDNWRLSVGITVSRFGIFDAMFPQPHGSIIEMSKEKPLFHA